MKMSEMLTWRCVMDKTIADRLKEARNKAGMHQEDAARSMEMSRPTLSAIESGKRVVSAEEVRKFSALYDASSNWLLYGDNSEEEARMRRLGKYYQLYSRLNAAEQNEVIKFIEQILNK